MAAATQTFNNGLYTPFSTPAATVATPVPFTLATPRFSIAPVTVENPKLATAVTSDALAATSLPATTAAQPTAASSATPVSLATSAAVSSATPQPDAEAVASSPNTLLPFFTVAGVIAAAVIVCVLWRRRKRIRSAWTRVRRRDDADGEKDAAFDPDDWVADPALARSYAYRQGDDLECGADRYGTVSSSRFNLAATAPIGRSQSAHFDDEKDADRGWEWGRDEALDAMLHESRARYSPDEVADMAEARDRAPRARLARAGSAILSTLSSFGRSGRGVRSPVPTDDRYDEHGLERDPEKAQ